MARFRATVAMALLVLVTACGLVGSPVGPDSQKAEQAMARLPELEANIEASGCHYSAEDRVEGIQWKIACDDMQPDSIERAKAKAALAQYIEAAVLAAQLPGIADADRSRIIIKLRLASYILGKWEPAPTKPPHPEGGLPRT